MLTYDVVDVFAEKPFAGNQLAVVHGAAGLSDEQLLTLAREFNFSETTFPTPIAGDRYSVRIFTPGGEIPFAGHPTLGTAWVLRERGDLDSAQVVQECAAGEVGVRFVEDAVELSAVPRDLVGPLDHDVVAGVLHAVGLTAEDRDGDAWLAGTGLTFAHVPVRDDAVARAGIARTLPHLPPTGDPIGGINLYSVTADLEVHSRVFVPDLAVPEDPATGSAAAGLGMALRARGLAADGDRYRIRQGIEMGRPSRLLGTVGERISVAGQVHPIARGEIRVP
ncbi:PhzF family phenazine biosynthesis protein [Nocardioides marmorisolisilvae]|uniref:PhzF family phenazine biosynthesis protein n=1 Tax=Nocardioides marmorisolisilvae TaxID=1542737 RepID=UPI001C828883|nr:PhzF family phenazine biosynthesis protein [Nocardioides marmorisolisilvae]